MFKITKSKSNDNLERNEGVRFSSTQKRKKIPEELEEEKKILVV
jgi:hypothetical protein